MYAVGKAITKIVAQLVTGSRGRPRAPSSRPISAYARLARACSRLVRVIRWLTRVISWLITGTKHSGKPLACAATAVAIIATAASSSQASGYPTPQAVAAHAEFLLNAPPPPSQAAVCVIDTGVSVIPELEGKVIARRALDGGTLDDVWHDPANPASGHGTFVASAIAGSPDGRGGAGIWPQAKIVSVRVFRPGTQTVSGTDWVNAIHRCKRAANDVKIINISLGGGVHSREDQIHLRTALERARGLGINVIAAGGNNGTIEFPASFDNVTAVGGISPAGIACPFPQNPASVHLLAPGCGVSISVFTRTTASIDGSSIAAPFVSGVMAALRSYRSDLSPQDAEELVLNSARRMGLGRGLDAEALFRAAGLAALIPARPQIKNHPYCISGAARNNVPANSQADRRAVKSRFPLKATKPNTAVVRPPRIRKLSWKNGRLRIAVSAPGRGEAIVFKVGHRIVRSKNGRLFLRLHRARVIVIYKMQLRSGRRSPTIRCRVGLKHS